MTDLTTPVATMKVKPVRMPMAMIEQGEARAKAEGLRGGFSELVRTAVDRLLADPEPLCEPPPAPMPDVAPPPEELVASPIAGDDTPCKHPKGSRKYLGYVTLCGVCRAPLNRGR